MKISIVMPVYNVENYIGECVDSVLQQSLTDFELIMVDDGSRDSTGTILDEYQAKDSRVTVIHKENEGVAIERNTGLERCSGDYIYIMDSDDYLEPDALEIMYKEAVRTDADVIIADHFKFTSPESQTVYHYFPENFVTEDRKVILDLQKMVFHRGYSPYPTDENRGVGIGTPWVKLIKKDLIADNNLRFDPYVRGVFDDCLFSLAVFEFAGKVAYCRKALYHFRVLQSSLTHRFRPNQLEVYSRIFERCRAFGKKYKKGEDYRKAYYARVITYFSLAFDTYFFNHEYEGGKRKNYREFKETIKSKTYNAAIRKADINILEKREKRIVTLSRKNLVWLLWLAYTLRYAF